MTPRFHVFLLLALTLLPSIAVAAAVVAMEPAVPMPSTDGFNPFTTMGGTTISAVAIGSWTWIFKWMVNQLELQRQAHAQAQSQLIQYMKDDHTLIVATNQALTSALTLAISTLNKITLSISASHPPSHT